MQTLRELRAKFSKLVSDARVILEAADKEERTLTSEENDRYDRIMADALEIKQRIGKQEALETASADLDSTIARRSGNPDDSTSDDDSDADAPLENRSSDAYRSAFTRYLRGGIHALNVEEQRALQVDVDSAGGYLVAPMQFVNDLLKNVDDAVFMRTLATVRRVETAQSLGVPSIDTDPSDSDWTSEIGTGNEDTAMAVGRRELHPQPLAKRIKVSNKLIRATGGGAESIVRERLAYKFGITEEKAFQTGSGANEPLGVFTASANGINTDRDSSSGSATSITADALRDAKYTLKGQYWPRARWLFHRDAVKIISKLKDGNSQYLWQPGLRDTDPDRLIGFPILMSEYTPNTFTTGLYVGMLADFSAYWIADALDLSVQRLVELYAETNQVGFIGRLETDGMPTISEAFVRLKTD